MSGGYYGPHSFNTGPWHFCMRCDTKTKLTDLEWQRGLLVCRLCRDPWPLLGQREEAIAEKLEDGKVDFEVSAKLREPEVDTDDLLYF